MKNFVLTIGSFGFIWLYLIIVAVVQIILCHEPDKYKIFIVIMSLLLIFSFLSVKKLVKFKTKKSRNDGIKKFSGIRRNRNIGMDFVIANVFPLMNLNVFEEVSFSEFSNTVLLVGILLIIVSYSQNFAFNPFLYILGFRVYTNENADAILLMKPVTFGNKHEHQEKLIFEEFENSNIYVIKEFEDD